jgi:hypothetical protein
MLITNRGSTRLDTVGIALTAPHLILLARDSAVPTQALNTVSQVTEYAGAGYTGGFGGASRFDLTGELSVAEDDGNNRSEISFTPALFSGVNGPDPIAPIAASIEEITDNAGSNLIAFHPLKSTAQEWVPNAASEASPAQLDGAASHGLTTDDLVYIEGFAGGTWATQLNGKVSKITVVDANSFSLQGVDSSGFGTATFATAKVYRPLWMNGAPVTVTADAEGAIQSRTVVGAV